MNTIVELINSLPIEQQQNSSPGNNNKFYRKPTFKHEHSIIRRSSISGKVEPSSKCMMDDSTVTTTSIEDYYEDDSIMIDDSGASCSFDDSFNHCLSTSLSSSLKKDTNFSFMDMFNIVTSPEKQPAPLTEHEKLECLAKSRSDKQRAQAVRITQDSREFRRFKAELRNTGILTTCGTRALLRGKIDASAARTAKREDLSRNDATTKKATTNLQISSIQCKLLHPTATS